MTFKEFALVYDSTLKDEEIEYLLMEQTAFPFADIKTTLRQLRSAIRANKNNIPRCDLCGMKQPYHSQMCLNDGGTKND